MQEDTPTATASSSVVLRPYPNVLQQRHTTDEHRRIAAAAVRAYRDTLDGEQHLLEQREDALLSEEETARLEHRVRSQNTANATAAQYRQRACEVVDSTANRTTATATSAPTPTVRMDPYHAACDGDVAALEAWTRSPAFLSAESADDAINAPGQPNPAQYNGVQFQQRWLFRAPPLIFAAAFGREAAVRFLLAHGADSQVKSSTGLRAVDYAERRGYAEIVELLHGSS